MALLEQRYRRRSCSCSYDPLRFRPAMLFAVLEKLAFAILVSMLFASGRVFGSVVVFGSIDFAWAALFATAWVFTGRAARDVSL